MYAQRPKIYALKLKALGLKIKPEYIEKLGIDS